MDTSTAPDVRGGFRTAQDACATLVELARALKGWLFYPVGGAARGELVDRTWLVFMGEIGRNGPLALEVRRGAFWLAGTDVAVGVGRLDELARRFQERGVGRIAFDAELEPAAIVVLLDVLAADATDVVAAGGFEPVYFARPQRGIGVNESDWHAFMPSLAAIAASEPDITVPDLPPEPVAEPEPVAAVTAAPEPPAPSEPLPPALPEAPAALPEAPPAFLETEPPPAEPDREADPIDLLDALDPEPPAELAAPAEPPDQLGERLRELAECASEARYRDSARQLAFEAQGLLEQGRFDDAYRVLDGFARHAGDDAKRSFAERETARECLRQLGRGVALGDLVRRICDGAPDASLRAVAVLREIGAAAAPRLLDEIEREPAESERRRRLASALFALGDEAAPALAAAIASDVPRRRHAALRLAGESQNPRLVPSLRDALHGAATDAAREAAHALTRIGDVTAIEMLAEALESPRAGVVSLAAQALATTGRALAVPPLAAALDRSLADHPGALARDLVRALGRLGRPDAAPVLAELLERGGFFERRRLREIRLVAIQALAHVPGRIADDALARAARGGDAQQRQAAEAALRRRAHEAAKGRG